MILLSIITVNLNNANGLKRTIESVIYQKCENAIEYIIIDGESIDNSVEVIKEYDQFIAYWSSHKDGGIYEAMNKGISQANGKYLMFLNSGDILYTDTVIDLCHNKILEFKNTDIFYGNFFSLQGANKIYWKHPVQLSIAFFRQNNINHQASLIKSALFTEFGLYPTNYRLASDHWLYITSIINNKRFTYIDQILVNYDFTGQSSKGRQLYEEEMELIWEKLIPKYVDILVANYNDIEFVTRYPFLRKVVPIHTFFIYKKKWILLIVLLSVVLFLIVAGFK